MGDLLLVADNYLHHDPEVPPSFPSAESYSPRHTWEDTISRSIAEITQEQLWNGLSSLYNSNENLKEDAAALDSSSKRGEHTGGQTTAEVLDSLLDTFMNGANRILDELTIIGNSHPILAVAIFAFHEVIKLDIARRENNKKVLVVVLEMQNMLGPMFQLRNLDHDHMPDQEKLFHENRLKEVVEVITQDIKVCRSDITHFMNRKFFYKLVLSKGYEKKFATHIETFMRRRSELQSVISEYIAIGISSANHALTEIGKKVDIADDKLDRIAAILFRNLDTPRERDVFRFMQQHGGPEKCVSDLDLLPKLISKAGQSPITGKPVVSNRAELEDLRKVLTEVLNEDLDKVLGKHFLRFEKVLQVQNNNIKRMALHLENQGFMMQKQSSKLGQILDTVTTIMVLEEGKYKPKAVKLKDPEIHRVWTQMNLNSVVKAKVFVLTFRDHVRLDRSSAVTPTPSPVTLSAEDPNAESFLSATHSIYSDMNHPSLRPPMTMTESTRDFHTLQLAINSIEAEESSAVLESPLEMDNPYMYDETIELTTSGADVVDQDEDADADTDVESLVNTPKPTLRLTITDMESVLSQPIVDMTEVRSLPQRRQSTMTSRVGNESDEWVLEYIDAAYVKPIVEAIDEDGSGFISAQEANRFALARPDGMSLLHWIAYWAAGWHINITKYQKDIYALLLQISDIAPYVLTTNRSYVDDYLDVPVMTRLDALLRSIRTIPDNSRKDYNLMEVADKVAALQMERLKTNLSDMGYIIESSLDAVTIAGGSSRVETWILPLILLLLQRHRDIIRLASTIVLDPREFHSHIQSLVSVFSVFDERIENLEAKFRQLHSDIDAQFHNFSYGMFFAAYKKKEFSTSDHALLSRVREFWPHDTFLPTSGSKPDVSILSMPVGETFNPEEPILEPSEPPPENHVPHPIEGAWSGWFQPWEGTPHYIRPNRCIIHPIVDNQLTGKAEVFCGPVNITGTIEPVIVDPEPSHSKNVDFKVHFDFNPEHERYGKQCCWGIYNADKDTIEGTYSWSTPIRPLDVVAITSPIFPNFEGNNDSANQTHLDIDIDSPVSTSDMNVLVAGDSTSTEHDHEQSVGALPTNTFDSNTILDKSFSPQEYDGTLKLDLKDTTEENGTLDRKIQEIEQVSDVEEAANGGHGADIYPYRQNATSYSHDEVIESADGRKGDGRFILTRIPIHLLQYRYLLDGSGTPPCWNVWPLARKRWAFAIEAVLADTRERMNSAKFFQQSLIARQKWIYFGIRWYLTNPTVEPGRGWYPFEPLTREEWEVYDRLESYVSPTNSRLYELIANYLARREVHIVQVGRLQCDVCHWDITFARHQCVYCKDDDLLLDSRDVDVCRSCLDKPVPYREVSHSKSHSLLRSPYRIHKYEYKNVISDARFVSERFKALFREQEERRIEANKGNGRKSSKGKGARNGRRSGIKREPSPELPPILCACCEKTVSLPCWACVVCSPYTFVCDSCDRKNAPVTSLNSYFYHSRKTHQMLRIYDNVEIKGFRGGSDNDVGRQLEEINTTISSLEQKINKQLEEGKETKGVVDEMAKKVGISWSDDYSTSLSDIDDINENLLLPNTTMDFGDDVINVEVPIPVATQNAPTHYETTSNVAYNQTDLGRRLDLLEAKVEAKLNSLEVKMEETMCAKIDALEGKMDALFALVQNLVSSREK